MVNRPIPGEMKHWNHFHITLLQNESVFFLKCSGVRRTQCKCEYEMCGNKIVCVKLWIFLKQIFILIVSTWVCPAGRAEGKRVDPPAFNNTCCCIRKCIESLIIGIWLSLTRTVIELEILLLMLSKEHAWSLWSKWPFNINLALTYK